MAKYSNKALCLVAVMTLLGKIDGSADLTENSDRTKSKQDSAGISNAALFDKLFQYKRSEQKDALQRIVGIKSYEKQRKLLELVITKIMEVLLLSRVKLESSGYLPGSEFPEDEQLRDALSSMIENTAFVGDLVLFLPDTTKELLKNNEWSTVLKWSLSFCQEATVLNTTTKKMLHLVAQELNLVERDPNYLNPYAKANQKKPVQPQESNTEKKKPKRKFSKGPSLSGGHFKNEL